MGMTALLSEKELTRYRNGRQHEFAHDFSVEPIVLPQSVLLAAFNVWQGNNASRDVSCHKERLALVVLRMRSNRDLRLFATRLPTATLHESTRGSRFRFDDWYRCFGEKERERLVIKAQRPRLTGDGLRIGDDLVHGELDPARYANDVMELFGNDKRRDAVMALIEAVSPENLTPYELDDTLHILIRSAVR